MIERLVLVLALALLASFAKAQECAAPIDYLALPLPRGGDPIEMAMEVAYPGLDVDLRAGRVALPDGTTLPALPARPVDEALRLDGATLGDQFEPAYPLTFDLDSRHRPWFDPGRVRNEPLMRALWFDSEGTAQASLARVEYQGAGVTTAFLLTTKRCVAVQAAAALAEVAALGPDMDTFFHDAAGGFAWRLIAGTDRLSAHSYGIALDLNAALGGYWQWTGATEGEVGDYPNRIPAALVQVMEKRGFIWGGKWHHFDGMHFEYRPELILYARLTGS